MAAGGVGVRPSTRAGLLQGGGESRGRDRHGKARSVSRVADARTAPHPPYRASSPAPVEADGWDTRRVLEPGRTPLVGLAVPSARKRLPASGALHACVREEPGVQLGVRVGCRPRIVACLGIDREPDVTPTLPEGLDHLHGPLQRDNGIARSMKCPYREVANGADTGRTAAATDGLK